MSRSFLLIAMLLLATMALSACGKRGALEPPAVAPTEKSSKADSSGGAEPKPDENPHRPFVLDPILR